MQECEDKPPTMPLEPPAYDHVEVAKYNDELFQYHQDLRAYRARQAGQQTPDHTSATTAARAA
jgi:hypothetical protein